MLQLESRVEEKRVRSFDGAEIAYHVVGEGPTILLANGLGGSWRAWSPLLRRFGDRFRFVSWDYRGLYRSPIPADRENLGVSVHAEDGLAVLAAEGISRAGVFGWSMGVQVALEMTRRAPRLFEHMVLINGVAGSPFRTLAGGPLARRLAAPTLRGLQHIPGIVSLVSRAIVGWSKTPEAAVRLGLAAPSLDREVFAALAGSFAQLDMQVYARILELLGEHDAHDVLPRIEAPVLAIAGGRDLMTPRAAAARLASGVPRGELYVIPEGTHYLVVEFPEQVGERIERFFAGHGVGARR